MASRCAARGGPRRQGLAQLCRRTATWLGLRGCLGPWAPWHGNPGGGRKCWQYCWVTVGRLLPLGRWLAGVPPAAHVGKVLPGSAFWRLLGAGRLLGAKTWLGPCLGLSRLLKALGPAQGANHLAGALLGALAAAWGPGACPGPLEWQPAGGRAPFWGRPAWGLRGCLGPWGLPRGPLEWPPPGMGAGRAGQITWLGPCLGLARLLGALRPGQGPLGMATPRGGAGRPAKPLGLGSLPLYAACIRYGYSMHCRGKAGSGPALPGPMRDALLGRSLSARTASGSPGWVTSPQLDFRV